MEAPLCKICEHRHWAREPHISPAPKKSAPANVGGGRKAGKTVAATRAAAAAVADHAKDVTPPKRSAKTKPRKKATT